MRKHATMAIGALAVLIAGGCVWPRGESPSVHTFHLTLEQGAITRGEQSSTSPVLAIHPPQPAPGFASLQMVYLTRPYELEAYAVHQWADSPARLLAPLLVQALSEAGGWRAVVPAEGAGRADYRLDLDDVAVQQEFFQPPSHVRMRLRAQLVDLKDHRLIGAHAFEVVVPAPSEDAYGGVQAANRAATRLLEQVGDWLRVCVRQGAACNRP